MQATDYLLRALAAERITHVFLVPGGLIDPFLPALSSTPGVTPLVAAQEGGAAYMADGYARGSRRFGACFAIGGPGVTNMATAMATADSDGSAILLVSGQVATTWEGRGGFQDASPAALDDDAVLRPLLRSSLDVESPAVLPHHLRASLTRMLAGNHGPVRMTLPTDVQKAEIADQYVPLASFVYEPSFVDERALERVEDHLAGATNVVALVGAGIEKSGASRELVEFAERFQVPVATTLRAKGAFPEDHPLSLGVYGYAGTRHAIEGILSDDVDALLVLGSGLNQRDTMFWDDAMARNRSLVHVDVDPAVIGRRWPTEIALVGDCRGVLRRLVAGRSERVRRLESSGEARRRWLERVRSSGPRLYDAENRDSDAVPIHPARVIADLRAVASRDTVLVVDSGAHRAFCGQYWEAYEPNHYLSAANLGPMGWAIAAGIGAKLARPDLPHVVVTGDGCMRMHGLEVATAARYGVAVVYVVINNSALGNVWLRAEKAGPGPAALTGLPTLDWAGFARSLGADGATVEHPSELAPAFERALGATGPFVVDVRCDRAATTPVTPWSRAKQEWIDDH